MKDQRLLKNIRPTRDAVPSLFPLPDLTIQQQLVQQIRFFPTLEIKPGRKDEEEEVQADEEEFDGKHIFMREFRSRSLSESWPIVIS